MRKLLVFLALLNLATGSPAQSQRAAAGRYLFFMHNMFLEEAGINGVHPEYGKVEYQAIIDAFTEQGFRVISEVRPRNTDAFNYAKKIANQADSLITSGIAASNITIVGTSKGGYIAMYVSQYLANKAINYVLIGCCSAQSASGQNVPVCYGNVLSIYEKSDSVGRSCGGLQKAAGNGIGRFRELELHTGLRHGFLYKALPEWIQPAARWAMGKYD